MECDKLVAIVPKGFRFPGSASKQRDWYPVPHNTPSGSACDGDKKKIE